ncbi:hypothetical protein PROFUN_14914 [Planoprotostelium fungivorum]|uniref:DNA-directed DNA polymerase n=1 Tax=Planoprotostelium fungivorum TaxID=1890364 RepID=A0A2P6MY34_9EUKA|nr:hypothetical protein PROFUN_14914 [Planoprotostelium fungivorum]
MLDFVYNCLYQHYDKTEVDLLYTDTDSICMQAKVSSYEEFKQRFPDHLQKLHFTAAGDIGENCAYVFDFRGILCIKFGI